MRSTIKNNRRWAIVPPVMAMLAFAVASPSAQGRERILQLAEDGTTTRSLPPKSDRSVLNAAASSRVCEAGAKWIRLDFRSLVLRSYDSLVLTSSGGDRFVFQGGHWNNRSFGARAMRGACVDVQPYFASADSRYEVGGYTFGTRELSATSVVVAGAGDICDSTPQDCKATSDLIVQINPTVVFTAGDNAYSNGTLSEYNTRYAPNWGRFKELTRPTPGNHEYGTSGAAGYFDYFNGSGVQTGLAGDRSKGYYSYDVGDWHFVAMNTMSSGSISSTQLDWLRADLAANTKPCTAAYFHHPRWSTGNYTGYSGVQSAYTELYNAKADLILVGHDHNYQRSKKINASGAVAADGFRQVLVGTGGRDFYPFGSTNTTVAEVRNANTWGVLKLTLSATGYTADFVPVAGSTFTDRFTGTCNKAGSGGNTPPVANFSFATNGLTASFTDGSTDSDGTIASRSWNFGDGTSSTATNPSKTYAAAGTYNVSLTVTDNGGASHSVSRAVTVSSGGGASQLLLNPGFESGATAWSFSHTGIITNSTSRTPRSGSWYARLGGVGSTATRTLSQSVAIPSGRTSATLSLYLKIDTAETTSSRVYDTLAVEVRNSAGSLLKTCATYSNLNKGTSYVLRSCDLTPYIGQTVSIRFSMTEDSSLQTSFVIDDTAVNVQ